MVKGKKRLEDCLAPLPKEFRATIKKKLAFKEQLECDGRLQIPSRIWLALLLPRDPRVEKHLPEKLRSVWDLKLAGIKTFSHPEIFLNARSPLRHLSDRATCALLQILFDFTRPKTRLPRERYDAWFEVANRLGLWKLRYALEDAVFKEFDTENFSLFESVLEKQMVVDRHLILSIRAILSSALRHAGLKNFSIENRRKNIYGVYRKVALKQKNVNEIYDIHGFRILTSTPQECCKVVEVLHRLWPHFSERYKDYISKPKPNGYQSIHTVLRCLEGKRVEFQVRTREMDVVAASGPANHAEYKKSPSRLTFKRGA